MLRKLHLAAMLIAAACGGGSSPPPATPTPFTITEVIPSAGTAGVPNGTGINLVFSRPVDESSLSSESVKVVAENGREIAGTREVGRLTPNLVLFTPWENFVPSARHTITVTTEVRDTTGAALAQPLQSDFTAEDELPDMPKQFLVVDLEDELSGGRWFHRATLLPNNRILVAGGYLSGGVLQPRVEVLDPFTESASVQPSPLLASRAAHVQVLLDDGTVLLAGGETNDVPFQPLASAERWDYRTGESVAATPMHFRRSFAEAVKLPDGRVVVTGGQSLDAGGAFVFRDDAEIYDPAANQWTHLPGPASRGRSGHGNWALSDGRILLLGGTSSAPSADVLDPATGSFSAPAGFPPEAHIFGSYATLANGQFFYASGAGSKEITLFDERFGFLSALNAMLAERAFATSTTLPNGRVVIAGGTDFSTSPAILHTTIDLFVPEQGSGTVFRVPSFTLPAPTSHHAAVLDTVGDLWLIGGLPGDASLPGRRQVTRIRFSLQ